MTIVIALLLICGISTARAHVSEGVIFAVYQFADAEVPVMYGDLSDWDLVPEQYFIDMYDLEEVHAKLFAAHDTTDLHIRRVAVGWNDTHNRLYFMAEVYDDVVRFEKQNTDSLDTWYSRLHGTHVHGADIWEIVIDADHGGELVVNHTEDGNEEVEMRKRSAYTQNYHLYMPLIVSEKADLKGALASAFFGAVGTAGQRCTSTRRLIVHEKIYRRFLRRLIDMYEKVRIGNPLDPKTLMGPLIDEDAVAGYEAAIVTAQEQGGKLLYGGRVLRARYGRRTFVQPTIVEISPGAKILQTETFAPILYVMKYKSLRQAISIHNGVPQGLSSGIFTDSMSEAETFVSYRGSDCGIANINVGTSGAEIGGAFGGEKETGGGRESGSDAWKAYMRRQTNTVNWGGEIHLAQGVEFSS